MIGERVPIAKLGPTAAELVADVVNELTDVDVAAVSIVNKGANRKRYFLRRSGERPTTEELIESPADSSLIVKGGADEWSAVYCVVAEPGWLEDAGMIGDQAVADRWASEDEIRKAAHKFMRNGALVNRMHESLEPFGQLVENAVALADFTVEGTDGEAHVIRKGSWYIAFEPTAEGRDAIEKGEFTGVSIEGTGIRTPVAKGNRDGDGDGLVDDGLPTQRPWRPRGGQVADKGTDELGDRRRPENATNRGALAEIERELSEVEERLADDGLGEAERTTLRARAIRLTRARNTLRSELRKAEQFTKPGIANVSAKDLKTLAPLMRHYASKAHPFTSCYRDQVKHGLSKDHAKRRCAVLKQLIRGGAGGRVAKVRVSKGKDGKGEAPWTLECGPALDRCGKALEAAQTDSRGTVSKGMRDFLRKLGEKLNLSDDELALLDDDESIELEKSRPTFAERMAQRDFEDELPQAFDVLRSAIWSAFYPDPNDEDNRSPGELIEQSLDEFKAWATDLLNSTDIAKVAESIEKAGGQTGFGATVEDVDEAERTQIAEEAADKVVAALPDAIKKALDERESKPADGEGDKGAGKSEDEPTIASLAKSVEKLTDRVEALGAGGSSQGNGSREGVQKGAGDQPWAGVL